VWVSPDRRLNAGDNLWLHRAIYEAEPGDVIVASVGGEFEWGYWGEIMSSAALARKLGGLVVDGCVRDRDDLERLAFPIFSRGLSVRGTSKDAAAPGSIGQPILIGDVVIAPGDLIRGDADGVVAIPAARLSDALDRAAERERAEREIAARLARGERTLDIYGWQ
jgi:4-hydroxy-4-methyl-2-oxoglutarate aldolase